MKTIVTYIAGVKFRGIEAQVRLRRLPNGTHLYLEAEPDNAYDANAVKVLGEDNFFYGYVPAKVAKDLDLEENPAAYWAENALYITYAQAA